MISNMIPLETIPPLLNDHYHMEINESRSEGGREMGIQLIR